MPEIDYNFFAHYFVRFVTFFLILMGIVVTGFVAVIAMLHDIRSELKAIRERE